MVDEDVRGTLRELKGLEVGTCDVCGRTVTRDALVVLSTAHPAVEQADEVQVCPDCHLAMEQGEVPLEDEEEGAAPGLF